MTDILLIDDMAGVRRAVVSMLKRGGHTVTAAESGGLGIELLRARRFDVVITRMLMPNVDGADVLAQVGRLPERPRVIAISGGGDGQPKDSALGWAKSKADTLLDKPFHAEELLAAVDRLLAQAA
jgi:CheY-like chemotaxis protein